jgi:hypothetical protein
MGSDPGVFFVVRLFGGVVIQLRYFLSFMRDDGRREEKEEDGTGIYHETERIDETKKVGLQTKNGEWNGN